MTSEEQWDKVHEVKDKYCSALLKNPHVNYVGVSLKEVGGQTTDIPTIVVGVKKKLALDELNEEEKIPAFLDSVPTDVVEGDLNLVKLEDIEQQQEVDVVEPSADASTVVANVGNMDPFKYAATITSGMSIAKYSKPMAYGTVGCFVTVNGSPQLPGITVGTSYLVTCQHVLPGAAPSDPVIIPARKQSGKPPAQYSRAVYVSGIDSDSQSADVAAVELNSGVQFKNEVPTANSTTTFAGVLAGWPKPGDAVFKYGATTWYTSGSVKDVNVSAESLHNIMRINGEKSGSRNKVITDTGDSGSVIVIQSNAKITGLLFAANLDSKVPGGCTQCYAYRMDSQLSKIAGSWALS